MIALDENRQRQEAYRNLMTDLDLLDNKSPLEDTAEIQKLFEDIRLISFVGHALTNYIFMVQNFADPYDRKRKEIIYELAISILQSSQSNLKSP